MHRVDPHRHFGGCITPEFVATITDADLDLIRSEMQFSALERPDFYRFLKKFEVLDTIEWSEQLLISSIAVVCAGLQAERIDYTYLRFSLNKYLTHLQCTPADLVALISDTFAKYRPGGVGLILSLKYESLRGKQLAMAKLLDNASIADRLIGLDLVGDEACFDAEFYRPIFADWRAANKLICAHVGESQPAANIKAAIEILQVGHVAHGIKIINDDYLMALAKERQICFDLALTSNYLTGVWSGLPDPHPIRVMFDAGLSVTIGTDDPVQCATTLDREFEVLATLGFSEAEALRIKAEAERYAVDYKFLPSL